VKLYTHLSDQYGPYHTTTISATASEAPYLVDGLLYHETDIEIAEHYSDTAAFSDLEREECHDHRAPRRPPSCGRSEAVHGGHSEAVRSS
jgi:TnpA family transposase